MTHDDHDGGLTPEQPQPLDRDERFAALEQLAATDPMTGLLNRRGFAKRIAAEMTRAEQKRKQLSCILLDINQLDDVNKTYGYMAGDRVLREISTVLSRMIRPSDLLARWGGDEFLIVLPDADLEYAQYVAACIGHAVKTHEINGVRPGTVTAGVATIDSDYYFNGTLAAALRRLNQAKQSGEGDADPHAAVREPRPHGPEGSTGRSSAASVEEPAPERRVDAIRRDGWPLPER